jgi:hypothetical protein
VSVVLVSQGPSLSRRNGRAALLDLRPINAPYYPAEFTTILVFVNSRLNPNADVSCRRTRANVVMSRCSHS